MYDDGASTGHPGRGQNFGAEARLVLEGGVGVKAWAWDPDQLVVYRDAEEARRQAEEATKQLVRAVQAVAREEGRQQQAEHVTPPAAPSAVQKLAKDPRGPSPATRAAVRALSHFIHIKGLRLTDPPSLLAKEIVDRAAKAGVPGAEILNLRSLTLLVGDAQDGTRLADEAED
jgi:hypothetical protein